MQWFYSADMIYIYVNFPSIIGDEKLVNVKGATRGLHALQELCLLHVGVLHMV